VVVNLQGLLENDTKVVKGIRLQRSLSDRVYFAICAIIYRSFRVFVFVVMWGSSNISARTPDWGVTTLF